MSPLMMIVYPRPQRARAAKLLAEDERYMQAANAIYVCVFVCMYRVHPIYVCVCLYAHVYVKVNLNHLCRFSLSARGRLTCVCVYTQGAPYRLPKPLSDQFPVRGCSSLVCVINRRCTCILTQFACAKYPSARAGGWTFSERRAVHADCGYEICMYACLCVCRYIHVFMNANPSRLAIYSSAHAGGWGIYIYIYIYIYICIYRYMCLCVCVCIYMHL